MHQISAPNNPVLRPPGGVHATSDRNTQSPAVSSANPCDPNGSREENSSLKPCDRDMERIALQRRTSQRVGLRDHSTHNRTDAGRDTACTDCTRSRRQRKRTGVELVHDPSRRLITPHLGERESVRVRRLPKPLQASYVISASWVPSTVTVSDASARTRRTPAMALSIRCKRLSRQGR